MDVDYIQVDYKYWKWTRSGKEVLEVDQKWIRSTGSVLEALKVELDKTDYFTPCACARGN